MNISLRPLLGRTQLIKDKRKGIKFLRHPDINSQAKDFGLGWHDEQNQHHL
jgi:hypothetical protein